MNLSATVQGTLFQSGAEATAVQTLRAAGKSWLGVKRLDCGAFYRRSLFGSSVEYV